MSCRRRLRVDEIREAVGFWRCIHVSHVAMRCCRGPSNWTYYTGSGGPPVNGSHPDAHNATVQPTFWFVDLLADFHVSNIVLTAGGNLVNASVYIGSDATSVFGNTLIVVRNFELPPADCTSLCLCNSVCFPSLRTIAEILVHPLMFRPPAPEWD